MKKSDLYREWARVLDMCEGTGVRPTVCVKYIGKIDGAYPYFNGNECDYEFALGILEGRPVFVGDEFFEGGGNKCSIKEDMHLYVYDCLVQHIDNVEWRKFSWTKPQTKKTFLLNVVELPCPLKNDGKSNNVCSFVIGNSCFYFDGTDEYKKLVNGICKILSENTK